MHPVRNGGTTRSNVAANASVTKAETVILVGSEGGATWGFARALHRAMTAAGMAKVAMAALAKVDLQMSTYRDDSDLMRLNRAPVGEWIHVPAELIAVLLCARAVAVQSDGALDVTLGQTVNAWGFGPDPTPANVPTRQDASQSYDLHAGPCLVRKNTRFAFDLSALAKGFAVDRAVLALEDLGIQNFLVEAAGEIVTRGCAEGGAAWKIGLELPVQGVSAPYDLVSVKDCAHATSGNVTKAAFPKRSLFETIPAGHGRTCD